MDTQIESDFHRCFVQFQETLCNLTNAADQNPFKATPQPDQVESAVLKAISSYRLAFQQSTDESQKNYYEQANSLMYLLQASLMNRGKGKIDAAHLESWIDECFPVYGAEDVWQSIYRYTLRRRFDQVCLLLQSVLDEQPSLSVHINIITELLLSYPTAKLRASNPYALSQWRLDLQTRLRLENVSSWDSRVANIITLVEGDSIPPSVRAKITNWQEIYIGKLVLSAKAAETFTTVLVKECLAEKPSAYPSMDTLSAALIEGLPLDYEAICALPLVGPHIIDLLALIYPNLTVARNNSIIQYANDLALSSLWNLCPDYLWASSVEGRQRLEALLFEKAKNGNESQQQSVLDICHNFDLFILADAIHVMLAEVALKDDNHRVALTHAIESGQNALVTRVCDAILKSFYAENNVETLALVDQSMFDSSAYPRLTMLLHIYEMEELRKDGHGGDAAAVLTEQILASSTLVPAYLKPRLLEAFLHLAPSIPADQNSSSLRPVLELLNDTSNSLDADLAGGFGGNNTALEKMASMSSSSASMVQQPSLDEPRSVVQQLVTKFQADSDIDSINRINEAFLNIQEQRAQKLSSSRDLLHQWMKKVETAKWEAQRPADRPAARHSEEMSTLERERFALAKSINDLESSLVQYETVLSGQKTTLTQLRQDNAAGAHEPASKLDHEWNLYRQLGIDWIGFDAAGQAKCRIADAARNDIHILTLNNNTMSSVEQANLLWNLCTPQA